MTHNNFHNSRFLRKKQVVLFSLHPLLCFSYNGELERTRKYTGWFHNILKYLSLITQYPIHSSCRNRMKQFIHVNGFEPTLDNVSYCVDWIKIFQIIFFKFFKLNTLLPLGIQIFLNTASNAKHVFKLLYLLLRWFVLIASNVTMCEFVRIF